MRIYGFKEVRLQGLIIGDKKLISVSFGSRLIGIMNLRICNK